MKTNESKKKSAGIGERIDTCVGDIRGLVRMGWTLDSAINRACRRTPRGSVEWDHIMASIRRSIQTLDTMR